MSKEMVIAGTVTNGNLSGISGINLAIHLDRIQRFSGNTRPGVNWSVLRHSLFVWSIAKTISEDHATRALALIHDIAELVRGDIPSPVKTRGDEDFERIVLDKFLHEQGWEQINNDLAHWQGVKDADLAALAFEAQYFADKQTINLFDDSIEIVKTAKVVKDTKAGRYAFQLALEKRSTPEYIARPVLDWLRAFEFPYYLGPPSGDEWARMNASLERNADKNRSEIVGMIA